MAHGFSHRGMPRADHHIGQTKQRAELMPVLSKSPIKHFPMPENILKNVKRMPHERAHRGLGFIDGFERFSLCAFGQRFELAALAGDLPINRPLQAHDLRPILHPGVAGVCVDLRLAAGQQFRRFRDVGRGDHYSVNQSAVPIRPDVRFHPEIPSLAFAGLVHLRGAEEPIEGRRPQGMNLETKETFQH